MRLLSSLALLCTVAAGAPAAADQQLSLSVSSQYVTDGGIFAASDQSNLVQAELVYAHSLKRLGPGTLSFEGAASIGLQQAQLFSQIAAGLFVTGWTAGLRYTLPIPRAPWLAPRLRLGLGGLAAQLSLDDGQGRKASGWSGAFTSYVLLGVEVMLPRRWMWTGASGVTGALVVEGGWIQSTDLAYTLAPGTDPNLRQLATTGTNLGALNLSGPVLRVGVALRF